MDIDSDKMELHNQNEELSREQQTLNVLSLLFLQYSNEKQITMPNLHQCFFLLFCFWTLRINSANGLEIKSTEGQSSLTVTNVTEEHYGNYTCVAANKLGVTNASLVLFSKYAKAGLTREN